MVTNAFQPTATPGDQRVAALSSIALSVRAARSTSFFLGNVEPTLDELIADPMVRRLMDRDGVEIGSFKDLIDEVRSRLR